VKRQPLGVSGKIFRYDQSLKLGKVNKVTAQYREGEDGFWAHNQNGRTAESICGFWTKCGLQGVLGKNWRQDFPQTPRTEAKPPWKVAGENASWDKSPLGGYLRRQARGCESATDANREKKFGGSMKAHVRRGLYTGPTGHIGVYPSSSL